MGKGLLSTVLCMLVFFFFSSRRRHTRFDCDWSSDVCSSDLALPGEPAIEIALIVQADEFEAAALAGLRRVLANEAAQVATRLIRLGQDLPLEIGRASCRERV